jgi:hypothetical protein
MPDPKNETVYGIELFYGLGIGMAIVTLFIILGLSSIVLIVVGFIPATIFFIALSVLFAGKTLHNIDASVPNIAVPKIFGNYVKATIGPGWVFVPFKGWLLDYLLMYGGELNPIFPTEGIIPGDRSTVSIPNDIYVRIDRDNPLQIIEVGGLDEAITRMKNQVVRRERIWLTSKVEGPQDLDHARQMSEEVIHLILEALLKDDMRRVDSRIPTEVLIGIYNHRRMVASEAAWVAEYNKLPDNRKKELMDEVGEHVEFIRDAREGRRPVHLKYLGLTIERFGADNIEPSGETIENVAAVNKAQFLAEQRKRAAKGLADAAKELAAVPGTQGDPTRTILIAEGIVKEDVKVTRLEASPQILTAAEGTLGPIFSALAGRIRGKE